MKQLINHIKDSILMRLWLICVALTKKNFICFAYNSVLSKPNFKGCCLFSHLPDKLNDAEQTGLDCLCQSIKEIKESKSRQDENTTN